MKIRWFMRKMEHHDLYKISCEKDSSIFTSHIWNNIFSEYIFVTYFTLNMWMKVWFYVWFDNESYIKCPWSTLGYLGRNINYLYRKMPSFENNRRDM